MRLSGHAEVTPHADIDYYLREHVRVHVPIVTQPTVRFACGDAEVNMAAGECWIFDTWRMHHVVTALLLTGLVACASARPILYDNDKYRTVGREGAHEDIDDCERLADAAADRAHTRFIVSSDPDDVVERIGWYVGLGFDHLVFHAPGEDQRRFLEQFCADVLPRLRARF